MERSQPKTPGRRIKARILLILFAVSSITGCESDDADRLARVGRKVTDKVQALVPERTPFRGSTRLAPTPNLEERVKERFKSDRFLAPLPIEITVDGSTVRLKGTVELEVLKRRAVEIADSTVGVEQVVDELVVSD